MPRRRRSRALGCLGATVVVVAVAAGGAGLYASRQGWVAPLPVEPRCVATSSLGAVTLTPEQARLASIIAGRSVALGLPPRAATIALATAYQESGIRNLDHGDRDSLGLFQQRPSKGWGTAEQVRDPWYASDAFYAALVKVPGWETGDINDTAQAVQRSGVPQGYRKHETSARILAEVLTGQRWAGLSCTAIGSTPADPRLLEDDLARTFGALPRASSGQTVRVTARSPGHAWAIAYATVAGSHRSGAAQVATNHLAWAPAWPAPAAWVRGADAGQTEVVIRLGS